MAHHDHRAARLGSWVLISECWYEYKDFPDAADFYAGVASGEIVVTGPFRAFSHREADPGYQVKAVVGADDVYYGDSYPAALNGHYLFSAVVDGEVCAVNLNDRRDIKYLFTNKTPFGAFGPAHYAQGPDGKMYFADLVRGVIARLDIAESDSGGTNSVLVRVGGTGTAALPPRFEVVVDGASLGQFAVPAPVATFNVANDALFSDFVFEVAGPAPRRVDLVFLNDGVSSGINRDLVVDYIEVNGVRFETEQAAVSLFTNAEGPQAIAGREHQFRNGTMLFDDLPIV